MLDPVFTTFSLQHTLCIYSYLICFLTKLLSAACISWHVSYSPIHGQILDKWNGVCVCVYSCTVHLNTKSLLDYMPVFQKAQYFFPKWSFPVTIRCIYSDILDEKMSLLNPKALVLFAPTFEVIIFFFISQFFHQQILLP